MGGSCVENGYSQGMTMAFAPIATRLKHTTANPMASSNLLIKALCSVQARSILTFAWMKNSCPYYTTRGLPRGVGLFRRASLDELHTGTRLNNPDGSQGYLGVGKGAKTSGRT
jgi:hypothetical protein